MNMLYISLAGAAIGLIASTIGFRMLMKDAIKKLKDRK